jgi:PKD repeat protein
VRLLQLSPAAVAFAALVVVSACFGPYESDFPVVVGNQTDGPIKVFADGVELGDVNGGRTRSFTIRLRECCPADPAVGPDPRGQATFAARDLVTGILSPGKSVMLSHSTSTYVSFNVGDFPVALPPPPLASFTFSPAAPGVNQDIFFNASASSAFGAQFNWDFGDGGTARGVTPTYRYVRSGVFTVTLAVIDQFGRSAAASKTVNVSSTSAQLVADFTVSPTNPTISFGTNTVFFDATPSSPGVTIWTWDFGDGSSGTGQRPAHTYVRRGTWVVRLTVGDDAGRSATTTRNVTVAP